MTNETDAIFDMFGDKSNVRMVAGAYRGLDGLRAVVDFDGGRVPAYFGSAWRPVVNDAVWVQIIDGVAWLMGPTAPLASDGTVVSVAGGLATISTDIGNIVATYNTGATLTAGLPVKLLAHGGYHVVGVKASTPVAPTPDPGGGGGGTVVTQTFTPIDSGSFQSGRWWTGQVVAGDSNQGCWFYDLKMPWTIPASAVGSSLEIYLNPVRISGADPIFTTHAHATKPGGSPGLVGGAPVDVTGAGWYPLPLSFFTALKSGGGSAGVGLNHGGYNIFASIAQDPQCGAIRTTYRY
ncbi:hypothetical protein [Microbacterium sp. Leaf320]|uniref:hypothetical protein n=1 Tax=Microbacterium sp. Leaf320 TaxID=1736334 RepID=UPI0006FD1417|nr:hypothetical protein [Microbacterium sp. Leaf320]KQQ65087.1 hypothetical protein ASF63_14055 [Microbacterium sp. Leaf320]